MQLRIELYSRLHRILARLFFRREDAERIAIELRLDLGNVGFDYKAVNTFGWIVAMAERDDKVDLLLNIALTSKPDNTELSDVVGEIRKNGYVQGGGFNIGYSAYPGDGPVDIVMIYEPPLTGELKSLRNQMAAYVKSNRMNLLDWTETDQELTCQVALMLMTPELMGSDRPYLTWVGEARAKGMRVVPLLIRTCDWDRLRAFAGRLPLPRNGEFVSNRTEWPDPDSAWLDIARGVLQIVEKIRK